MQNTSRKYLQKGQSIGFVPTMGALHEGHLSLIRRARAENDIVVVSIFVNPKQFGPAEDFTAYPRDTDNDIAKVRELGIDTLFIPEASLMYPEGFATGISVGMLSGRLCGLFRAGHFMGVATVVTKLLNLVSPTRSYFGQKDFQQTVVISRMVKDLNMNVEIVVCPTVREIDGLAMSSRNRYLTLEERTGATVLYRTMTLVSAALHTGTAVAAGLKEMLQSELKREPLITAIDYASLYSPETLEELQELDGKEVLIAIAVRLGRTRLIDNLLVNLS